MSEAATRVEDGAMKSGLHIGEPLALGFLFLGVVLATSIAAQSQEDRLGFPPAFVYLIMGVIGAFLAHTLGVRWNVPLRDPLPLERVAQFTLVIALFGAGLRFRTRPPGCHLRSVWALLALGMPAAIGLVAVYAHFAMSLPLGAAVLLGTAVAPTDPVLAGQIGVRRVGTPEEETRPAHVLVSAEAGLNDGLATPFALLGLLLVTHGGASWLPGWLGVDLIYETVTGLAIGILGGYGLAALVIRLLDAGRLSAELETFIALAVALLLYGAAQSLGSLGFLACFAGGVSFRRYEGQHDFHRAVHRGAERIERFLTVGVLVLLGSVLTFAALSAPGLAGWLLAPVLILAIRPLTSLPVLALDGTLGVRNRAFVAWFGVRGVAAIYYAATIVSSRALSAQQTGTVFWTIGGVVIVSVIVHGMTARPLAGLAEPV